MRFSLSMNRPLTPSLSPNEGEGGRTERRGSHTTWVGNYFRYRPRNQWLAEPLTWIVRFLVLVVPRVHVTVSVTVKSPGEM